MAYKHVKAWRKRTKKRLLEAFRSQCGVCGYNRCERALDFHHLDPNEKDFNLSKWRNKCSWERLVCEVRKCVLLCANCHREVHDGITDPLQARRFDESFAEYRPNKIVVYDDCPMCSGKKEETQKYCSLSCAGKAARRVDWDNVDLEKLLKEIPNYEAIGRKLGITGTAVKKRAKKSGIHKRK